MARPTDLVRAAATAANLGEASADLVLGSPLNLMVSHAVQSLLLTSNIQFSPGGLIFYEMLFFSHTFIFIIIFEILLLYFYYLEKRTLTTV